MFPNLELDTCKTLSIIYKRVNGISRSHLDNIGWHRRNNNIET